MKKGVSNPASLPPAARALRLEDVARLAGVSAMTVSRALRGSPGCSPETQARVAEAARKLGYRANPLVSVYQAHIRQRRTPGYQATLAWFSDFPERGHFERTPWERGLWTGAHRRAAELGYRMEEYWTGGGGELPPERVFEEAARCERVLRARGVPGIIMPTLFNEAFAQWSWSEVAIACIGEHLFVENGGRSPASRAGKEKFHVILTDYFANVRLACEQLRGLGYRRIGLALCDWHDEHAHRRYTGAFLAEQRHWPARERLPILRDDAAPGSGDAHLRGWLQRHRPDAVLCCKNDTIRRIEACGWHVPEDVGVAHLWWAADVEDWSGIDPRMEAIGAAAIDVLVHQLRSNERGAPAQPVCTSFRGQWHGGRTTRALART